MDSLVMLSALAMAGVSGALYLGWLLFRWMWNRLWDWHEQTLTTQRGDLR